MHSARRRGGMQHRRDRLLLLLLLLLLLFWQRQSVSGYGMRLQRRGCQSGQAGPSVVGRCICCCRCCCCGRQRGSSHVGAAGDVGVESDAVAAAAVGGGEGGGRGGPGHLAQSARVARLEAVSLDVLRLDSPYKNKFEEKILKILAINKNAFYSDAMPRAMYFWHQKWGLCTIHVHT